MGFAWAVIPQKRWLQYGQDNPARSYAGDAGHQYQQWATGWRLQPISLGAARPFNHWIGLRENLQETMVCIPVNFPLNQPSDLTICKTFSTTALPVGLYGKITLDKAAVQVRKALSYAPRKKRSLWVLNVTAAKLQSGLCASFDPTVLDFAQ